MRNRLVTPFWKSALESLPKEFRARHVRHIEQAERWELRLNALVESFARLKLALRRSFQAPRSAH